MSETFFQVVVRYTVKRGEVDTVLGLLAEMAVATRAEAGNISYDFFRGVEHSDQIIILESYVDAAGFAAHRDYEHIERIGAAQIIPRLASRSIQTFDNVPNA